MRLACSPVCPGALALRHHNPNPNPNPNPDPKQAPSHFDVICTENLFGDILSDAASVLPGSLGLMPSASLGSGKYMYEPSGGSAPDLTGLDVANPVAQILCTAMMLRYTFNLPEMAAAIETAVSSTLASGICTADIAAPGSKPCGTKAFGDAVCKKLSETHA